jgi:hypothetical protein
VCGRPLPPFPPETYHYHTATREREIWSGLTIAANPAIGKTTHPPPLCHPYSSERFVSACCRSPQTQLEGISAGGSRILRRRSCSAVGASAVEAGSIHATNLGEISLPSLAFNSASNCRDRRKVSCGDWKVLVWPTMAPRQEGAELRRPKLGGRDWALWVVDLPKDDLD